MLVYQPESRITLSDALEHDWFKVQHATVRLEESLEQIAPIIKRLHQYTAPKKFKQMATQIALNHLTAEKYVELQEYFELLDTQHTGFVSIHSLEEALKATGLSHASNEIAYALR